MKKNEHGKRVTVKEAAEIMGVNPRFIHMGLQTGRLPFGTAVKTSNRYTYHISPKLFEQYIEGAKE